jgi:small GTP-binding protein
MICNMNGTPKSLRLQIGVFGLRNAGKSSLLNRLSGQQISIVSSVPGTTTDPTEKAMELRPLGPVLLIDTAGLDDDQGMLGEMRVGRSRKVMERTDLALIVSGTGNWSPLEFDTAEYFISRKTPVIAVFNKSDLAVPERSLLKQLEEI